MEFCKWQRFPTVLAGRPLPTLTPSTHTLTYKIGKSCITANFFYVDPLATHFWLVNPLVGNRWFSAPKEVKGSKVAQRKFLASFLFFFLPPAHIYFSHSPKVTTLGAELKKGRWEKNCTPLSVFWIQMCLLSSFFYLSSSRHFEEKEESSRENACWAS